MSIDRIHGRVVLCCDSPGCHETLETDQRDFDLAIEVMRSERWRSERDRSSGEWCHFCPDCQ